MRRVTLPALVISLCLASLAPVALAAEAGPVESRVWPPHAQRARGLLLGGGFGVSGCTDDLCDDLDPLVYLKLHGLARIFNHLAVGLQLGLSFHDPDNRYTDVVLDTFIGLEVRGILPLGRFDLWTGIALGYMRHQRDGEVCTAWTCYDGSAWHDGFGFGWGFGALLHVTRSVAIGLDFWLYKPAYTSECWDGQLVGHGCDDPPDEDVYGITWNFGVTALWFMPF
ncbi:MAG: hypothetical protein RBU30_14900 [Polyangia bacterium]|jgi:hypothetical protein|nr:hypothetical protein [Polyangia bacterium]